MTAIPRPAHANDSEFAVQAHQRTQRRLGSGDTAAAERGQLVAHLGTLLASQRRGQLVVLRVHLDQLALVERAYGHSTSDELLAAVDGRLRSALRDGDWLPGGQGDRLVVACETRRGADVAEGVARRIRQVLDEPFQIGADPVAVTATIGVAIAASRHADPERLLADADLALGSALGEGAGAIELFAPAVTADNQALAQVTLPEAIRRGVERGEFVVHYQPVVDLESYELAGTEALVRWVHPERGLLEAEQFIDAAKVSGAISALGAWVLEEACRSAARWPRPAGQVPLGVAVNVSARQLDDTDFADSVRDTLTGSGLDPDRLTVEVTERAVVRHPDVVTRRLEELRSLGVRVAIDDFGTGYNGLGTLKDLPFDIIKVDRYFVTGLCVDPVDRAVLTAIVTLARALRLEVIAEGVETVSQAAELRHLGCTYAQGYLGELHQSVHGPGHGDRCH